MKIRDILGEDDVKIEPAPANMQQATNADGKVIATGPADKMAAVQQAAKDGVDFTPGGDDQQTSENQEEDHPSNTHFHNWMHSEYSPYSDEAGDDNKVFSKALNFLRSQRVHPNEIEYHAKHMAHKFHGSDIDEESSVYPSRNPGTPAAADAATQAANPAKVQSAVYPSRNTQESHHDLISQGNHDVGGDATDSYINQIRDKDFERAQHEGIFGLGNKTPEEWAKTSTQMATLLQFQQKYQGTPYAEQITKRIQLLKDRLDMDAGEVAGPGGAPKAVVAPDQFDMKQLKEADNALLEKMRMIAGLR
jgi:hypothetical protein